LFKEIVYNTRMAKSGQAKRRFQIRQRRKRRLKRQKKNAKAKKAA
jgi:hypothetical protein